MLLHKILLLLLLLGINHIHKLALLTNSVHEIIFNIVDFFFNAEVTKNTRNVSLSLIFSFSSHFLTPFEVQLFQLQVKSYLHFMHECEMGGGGGTIT
jgi:hypothetical protein